MAMRASAITDGRSVLAPAVFRIATCAVAAASSVALVSPGFPAEPELLTLLAGLPAEPELPTEPCRPLLPDLHTSLCAFQSAR